MTSAGVLLAVLLGSAALPDNVMDSKSPIEVKNRRQPDTSLRLQCWQEGQQIIDEQGPYHLSPNIISLHQAILFSRSGRADPVMYLVPTFNATCLVTKRF